MHGTVLDQVIYPAVYDELPEADLDDVRSRAVGVLESTGLTHLSMDLYRVEPDWETVGPHIACVWDR